jgi:glycosyltransferase involved in cell wall biosynthesis
MKLPLYFDWGVSMLFGWGIYGLNILRHWPRVSGSPALCVAQIQLESFAGSDPLTLRSLTESLIASDHLRLNLAAMTGKKPKLDGIVLHGLGNNMGGSVLPRDGGYVGDATAAAIFFEDTRLADVKDKASDYEVIITGSTWCEQILRSRGVDNVATVIQGIDPATFHPAPRSDLLPGRFAVFSGGKLEHRKAQDLVVLAFRAFASRHPEAILVTAWHSPWAMAAITVNSNPDIVPISLNDHGGLNIPGWVAANGIKEDQFVDLGAIPNHQMARVVREMDVALFPNRCEGGTNLVAMECMACGIPTILSNNTGHLDLVSSHGTYPLNRQGPVIAPEKGTEGWGESDIEEMVEALEMVWRDRSEANRRAAIAAAAMADWSWHHQIGKLHEALESFCP